MAATTTAVIAFRTVPCATDAPTVTVSKVAGSCPVVDTICASMTSLPSAPRSLVRTKYCPSPNAWTIASGCPLVTRASLRMSVPGSFSRKSYVMLVPDTKSMPRLSPGMNSRTIDAIASTIEMGMKIFRDAMKFIRRLLLGWLRLMLGL